MSRMQRKNSEACGDASPGAWSSSATEAIARAVSPPAMENGTGEPESAMMRQTRPSKRKPMSASPMKTGHRNTDRNGAAAGADLSLALSAQEAMNPVKNGTARKRPKPYLARHVCAEIDDHDADGGEPVKRRQELLRSGLEWGPMARANSRTVPMGRGKGRGRKTDSR